MTIDLETVLSPNPACPVREIGAGLVIMAPDGTATHSLDEVGAFLWRLFDGRRNLNDVVDALVAAYDVAPDQATADVRTFLAQLVEADLMRPV